MVTVEKLGGNWVIVRSDYASADNDADGSSAASEIASSPRREFWTGDGWTAQYGFARPFLTQEEAEDHLAENQHGMA
jgi:hypothetical protein